MSLLWIILAIALILFFVWLAMQPKQGARASNAPPPVQRDTLPSGAPQRPRSPKAQPITQETYTRSESTAMTSADVQGPASESGATHPTARSREAEGEAVVAPTAAPASVSPEVPQSLENEVQQLLRIGQKINAIKRVQAVEHWGLKAATDYVEALAREPLAPQPTPHTTAEPMPELEQEVRRLLADYKKVAAVKLVRDSTGWHLRDAKNYVDAVADAEFQALNQTLSDAFPEDTFREIRALVANHQPVEAAQRIQRATGCNMSQAVDYIAQIRRVYPPQ